MNIPHEYTLAGNVIIGLHGKKRRLPDRQLPTLYGARAKAVCVVKAPGKATSPGYQHIAEPVFGNPKDDEPDVYAEGVRLSRPGQAAVINTADCPTLVLYEAMTGTVIVTHAGRAALTPTNQLGEPVCNIVTIAHELLLSSKPISKPVVHAYVTGAICGSCFKHDTTEAGSLIAPFDVFGSGVFIDRKRGMIDLTSVIKKQLLGLGVSPTKIHFDGICTYEMNWLASYRRDRGDERNAVVVTIL